MNSLVRLPDNPRKVLNFLARFCNKTQEIQCRGKKIQAVQQNWLNVSD